jgi:hypothetical protein
VHTRLPGGVLTPPAVDDAGWAAGPSHGYLREYVSYWADGFDWPAQEAALNAPKSTSMPVSRAAADPSAAPRLGRVRAQGRPASAEARGSSRVARGNYVYEMSSSSDPSGSRK